MKWIDINEKKPKEFQDVWMVVDNGSNPIVFAGWMSGGKYYSHEEKDKEYDYKITHWMEFPKVPSALAK